MSVWTPMSRSIGARFAAVVCLTAIIVGAAGYLAGRSILEQVAGLADDQAELNALTEGQKAVVDLHRERRLRVEPMLETCAAGPRPLECAVPGVDLVATTLDAEVVQPEAGWESETTYVGKGATGSYRFAMVWEDLKPKYATMAEVIGIRQHVTTLLPSLTSSFLNVFAAALFGGMVLGLSVTYLLSRRFAFRVKELVGYTRRIGTGELSPAPVVTRGEDEIGLLAEAMHVMAKDLDETRQRLMLAEKMQSWQNVARKVAHEIKNPLTPISLVAAELKRMTGSMPAGLRESMEEASRILAEETASLGRMVREFSAFARLPEPDLQAGDLGELVKDFVARNETESGPVFRVEAPASGFPVVMDRGMIIQVLHNLVNNAALAKAPQRLSVALALTRSGTVAVLDVTDDASGVPEHLRQTLFDAYVTSRSTGDGEKGMGLGLTISRKIAIDHGGALALRSTGPEGSCFRLTLPLASFGMTT